LPRQTGSLGHCRERGLGTRAGRGIAAPGEQGGDPARGCAGTRGWGTGFGGRGGASGAVSGRWGEVGTERLGLGDKIIWGQFEGSGGAVWEDRKVLGEVEGGRERIGGTSRTEG
jgi:hypothetical protein